MLNRRLLINIHRLVAINPTNRSKVADGPTSATGCTCYHIQGHEFEVPQNRIKLQFECICTNKNHQHNASLLHTKLYNYQGKGRRFYLLSFELRRVRKLQHRHSPWFQLVYTLRILLCEKVKSLSLFARSTPSN